MTAEPAKDLMSLIPFLETVDMATAKQARRLCKEVAKAILITVPSLQAENDKLNVAIKRQSGAAKTLRASIMAEVQHLKDMDRGEYFASKSLDSEREANSILTAERDAWKARAEAAEAVEILKHCLCGTDKDRIKGLEAKLAKAQSIETMLWNLLEEVEAQVDLNEEISREFADKVHIALWGE